MYEDDDLWPLKCPECLEEFSEKIGRIKTGERIKCPGADCTISVRYPPEQFKLMIAQAKAGFLDPWGSMIRPKEPPKLQ